jgi:hypothetical protein
MQDHYEKSKEQNTVTIKYQAYLAGILTIGMCTDIKPALPVTLPNI